MEFLIENKIIPAYFPDIIKRLSELTVNKDLKTSEKNGKKYFVSGGTDLFVQKPDEMLESEIYFLESDPSLKGISIINNECRIGSLTSVSEILESEIIKNIIPGIENFSELFGSTPIRNSATVGGNINNASPIGDMTAFFLALNSRLILTDGISKRSVDLNRFYKSYKVTGKKPEEYMECLYFKIPEGNYFFNFEKVSKRTYLDIASVNTAVLIFTSNNFISEIYLSAGGVSAVPLCLTECCKFLKDKKLNYETLSEAILIAQKEITPISDARGSAEYKKKLLSGLIFTHFVKLFPEIFGNDNSKRVTE